MVANRVSQLADALDFDGDNLARLEPAAAKNEPRGELGGTDRKSSNPRQRGVEGDDKRR